MPASSSSLIDPALGHLADLASDAAEDPPGLLAVLARVTDLRASNISRKFNVPPSYVLIHRVATAGIGVLCQLECEGPFRAEVLRWVPGYADDPLAEPAPAS